MVILSVWYSYKSSSFPGNQRIHWRAYALWMLPMDVTGLIRTARDTNMSETMLNFSLDFLLSKILQKYIDSIYSELLPLPFAFQIITLY